MPTTLITGVAGFLGSNLLDKLIKQGHQVIGIDNLSKGKLENLSSLLEHKSFRFFKKDILAPDAFSELGTHIDTVVHLAAYKIPRYGKALDTLKINAQGGERVLDFCRERNIKCVMASTSDVYGMSTDLPFREDAHCLIGSSQVPRWAYAVSKLFDEHLALSYMDAYGFPVVLLRFFGSYGPHQHLSWWGGPQSVFIEKVFQDKVIPIHGNGLQTRTFTYVEDTVEGIYRAITMDAANGHIFNIGAGQDQEITIIDLARLIKKLSGTQGELKYELIPYDQISKGRKYQDVMRRVPCTTKAAQILGFKAKTDLADGLINTMKWQLPMIPNQIPCALAS